MQIQTLIGGVSTLWKCASRTARKEGCAAATSMATSASGNAILGLFTICSTTGAIFQTQSIRVLEIWENNTDAVLTGLCLCDSVVFIHCSVPVIISSLLVR